MFNTTHLHPMIVHFPVALITIGFLAEVISLFFKKEKCLSRTGFYLMLLGTLGAIAAWSTGHLFTNEPAQGEILNVFEKHETGALITMIIMIIGSGCRVWLLLRKMEDTGFKWIAFVLYFLGFVSVTYTGLMGGNMVYNFMMAL